MELDNLERHELAAEFVSNPKSLIKAFQQWIDRFESLDSRQSAAVREYWQSFERIADAMDFAKTKSSLVADFANRTERVRFLMTKFFRDFPFVPETAADTWQDLLRIDVEHFRQNLLFNESVPGEIVEHVEQPKVILVEDKAILHVHEAVQSANGTETIKAICARIAERDGLKPESLKTQYYRWRRDEGLNTR